LARTETSGTTNYINGCSQAGARNHFGSGWWHECAITFYYMYSTMTSSQDTTGSKWIMTSPTITSSFFNDSTHACYVANRVLKKHGQHKTQYPTSVRVLKSRQSMIFRTYIWKEDYKVVSNNIYLNKRVETHSFTKH
jgi:hypothetical protein